MLARIEQQRQESVSENKEKGGAELISKTISQKTIWIGGNPGAPVVESNEQVEQTVQRRKKPRSQRNFARRRYFFNLPPFRAIPSFRPILSPPPPPPLFRNERNICNSKYDAWLLN